MGTSVHRKWSCDNCSVEEYHPQNELTPKGWAQMHWNAMFPIGAADCNGWRRIIVCGDCIKKVTSVLDVVFNEHGTPVPPDKQRV